MSFILARGSSEGNADQPAQVLLRFSGMGYVAVALLVATFKAGLVAAIFMHLSSEKRMIYRILIFTFFFVFGLFWLIYLAWYDPITR